MVTKNSSGLVFDKDSKEKKVINEPGYSLSKKLYMFTCIYGAAYYIQLTLTV